MLLNQFHNVLFWLSIEEFSLLCLLLIFFMRAPGHMWFFLLNLAHIPRGFLGFQIQKRVPKSHDLIEALRPRTDEESQLQMTFVQYELRVQSIIVSKVKEIYGRIQYKLRVYFILTMVCCVADVIAFIVQLVRFSKLEGDEKSDVLLLSTCYLFLIIDFYYACWIKNVRL